MIDTKNLPLHKNEEIELTITGFTAEGSAVGHYEGMAVFVAGGAVGDRLKLLIIKVKKTYAIGKIVKILTASPDRTDANCPVFPRCGGCSFRHITYESECKHKQQRVQDAFTRLAHLDVQVDSLCASPVVTGYRNKAQYPVAMENGRLKTGFYAPYSHRVIDCRSCALQPTEFADILRTVSRWAERYKIPAYDEKTGKGLLRHVYIRKAEATGQLLVTLVINGNRVFKEKELIAALKKTNENIVGMLINENTEDTNVILGEKITVLDGKGYMEDILCGLRFRISPHAFYQVNRQQAENLYAKAAEFALGGKRELLMDLYCGTGTIGLTMADRFEKVIGVEIVPQAIDDAKVNAKLNNITNAEFICGDAAKAALELENRSLRPDCVLVDPPRKGCDASLLQTIVRMAPERIVYVSCDPATLARDCAILTENGYTVRKAVPFDMFPRCAHVETVVLLSQRRPDTHIDIKLDLSELDVTAAETKATYQEIKDYVLDKFGLKVSTLYISQVKAKCGIIERECYNKGEGKSRVPQCPKEKEDAIMDALKHFRMI